MTKIKEQDKAILRWLNFKMGEKQREFNVYRFNYEAILNNYLTAEGKDLKKVWQYDQEKGEIIEVQNDNSSKPNS